MNRRKRVRWTALVIAVCATSGCRWMDTSASPVSLSPVAGVTAIEVKPLRGESEETVVISDRDTIDRFVKLVNAWDDGWKQPSDTTPIGKYAISVKQGDETVAVFWPSSKHLAGRFGGEYAESNRLRDLSAEEWDELQSILKIDGS